MLSAYERHLVFRYLANATDGLRHEGVSAARLVESLMDPRDCPTVVSKRLLSRMKQAGIVPDRNGPSACHSTVSDRLSARSAHTQRVWNTT